MPMERFRPFVCIEYQKWVKQVKHSEETWRTLNQNSFNFVQTKVILIVMSRSAETLLKDKLNSG